MRDAQTLEETIQRAIEAESILSRPLVAEAHDGIERAIVDALKIISRRDKEGIAELVADLKANERHRQWFKTAVDSGKVARKDLSLLDRVVRRFGASQR